MQCSESMTTEVTSFCRLTTYRRVSFKGVPHVVLEVPGKSASICYFNRSRKWRVFWPYEVWTLYQRRRDFDHPRDAFKFAYRVVRYLTTGRDKTPDRLK